ncbi:Leukocyte receptor cluster member 8, partial [Tetrabaena socialis]
MTYQAAYPAAAWAGAGADYYASYGGGYDYAAYYQQQQQQQLYAAEAAKAASAQPPPPPGIDDVPSSAAPAESSEVPPPPPPAPEAAEVPACAAPTAHAAADPSAATGYDAAYAAWYAQTYGAYYGYPGYDQQQQQQQQYWQQQQAYAYGAHPYAEQAAYQQAPSVPPPAPPKVVPPPAPPKGDPPPGSSAATRNQFGGLIDSYKSQPPPAGLYAAQPSYGAHQGRQFQLGATGSNMAPMGPRPPPGDPPPASSPQAASSAAQQQANRFRPAFIRPQLPANRGNAASAPAYIAVGSAAGGGAAAGGGGGGSAVAAAVAAGAAAAAVAAKAAHPSTSSAAEGVKWPASFTSWVTRCFNTARLRKIPDDSLRAKLTVFLEQVKADGRIWKTDWEVFPLMVPEDGSTPQRATDQQQGQQHQALSPSAPQSRKRSRWGAVPDDQPPASHDKQGAPGSGAQRQPYGSARGAHYERSQDVDDTDSEDEGPNHYHSFDYRGGGRGGKAPRGRGPASHHQYQQPHQQQLSNRKRKKLQQLEQQQQQHGNGRDGGGGGGGEPVWHRSGEAMRRAARAGRFGPSYEDEPSSGLGTSEDGDDEEATARRFGGQVVVGTCQALDKSYFRLTSQPDPATVRPEPVLERALARLVGMIAAREANYFYTIDQFKGMRQDCTVQHLRNGLAVRVYEAHARSSLEYGDTAEFNQCQARLGHLYGEGQPGCVAEFTAYRLLYESVHCAGAGGRGGGMAKALLHTMRNVPRELAGSPEIRHALQ